MHEILDFVDDRQKAWCIHCGQWIAGLESNLDHVPSKGLLLKPRPPKLPVVRICKPCNSSFSLDEEYLIAFLGSVLSGSTDPARQIHRNSANVLRSEKLRGRIDHAKLHYQTADGDTRVVWHPESDRINRVVLKNARGHVYYEAGEPMLAEPQSVWSAPLESLSIEQRRDFENVDFGSFYPEVGSRMLTRLVEGQDLIDGWVMVQNSVYRYTVISGSSMLVRTVLFEYLATEVRWET